MQVGVAARESGARPSNACTLLDGASYNIAGYMNGDFERIALEDAIAQINAAVWMLEQMEGLSR